MEFHQWDLQVSGEGVELPAQRRGPGGSVIQVDMTYPLVMTNIAIENYRL